MQRHFIVMSGGGLAVALSLAWAWLPGDHAAVVAAEPSTDTQSGPRSAASPPYLDWATPATPTTGLRVLSSTPTIPPPARSSATTGLAVPVTVLAPQRLFVGEMNELVVGLGANAGVSEISFAVQFDTNVLQVRAGTEGDWAAGAVPHAGFAAEISGQEDHVQIHSAVSGQPVGMAGGSVAVVQFQGVAPGTTSVLITNVVIKDSAGKWLAAAVAPSNLQITVDSVPPPQPEPSRQSRAMAVELPIEPATEGD